MSDDDVILCPCVVMSSLVHVCGVFMHDMFGCVPIFVVMPMVIV